MILKKIIFFVLFSIVLTLAMKASDETSIVQELNNEKKDDQSSSFVDTYFKKFFIKNLKLHTALRCAMPIALMIENTILFTYLLQSVSSLRQSGIKKSSLKVFSYDFLVASLFILASNGFFLDFYFSEVNRQESTTKE